MAVSQFNSCDLHEPASPIDDDDRDDASPETGRGWRRGGFVGVILLVVGALKFVVLHGGRELLIHELNDDHRVVAVRLPSAGVLDGDLLVLAQFGSPRELDLANNPGLTNAGLNTISKIRTLEVLDLSSTRGTDSGLEELRSLASLKRLQVFESGITDRAREQRRQALPNCEFVTLPSPQNP